SVFLTSAISVFRGWFQGKNKMFPTALSEIVEQLVKVGFGLLLVLIAPSNYYSFVALYPSNNFVINIRFHSLQ
ncbi:MAG: hypothetical protein E7063_07895, partial [Spirochaetaceae bacterium]|nr:hypothetical protein [Spirochaetaceae bacterium]